MKQFLIRYRHTEGTTEDWHLEIGRFISAIDADPALRGKIGYRCLKARDGADYFHIATVHEDAGQKTLQERDFFKHYTAQTRRISGGTVEVTPLETVAQTAD